MPSSSVSSRLGVRRLILNFPFRISTLSKVVDPCSTYWEDFGRSLLGNSFAYGSNLYAIFTYLRKFIAIQSAPRRLSGNLAYHNFDWTMLYWLNTLQLYRQIYIAIAIWTMTIISVLSPNPMLIERIGSPFL